MKERRRSDRYASGLGGKGTLLAVLIVIVIGAAGGMASNNETDEVKEPKEEATVETKKSQLNKKCLKRELRLLLKCKLLTT
ncbi:hypothetical protein QK289_03945 [Exiguobacterium antarcticum]|uniref:Uncharacterized protein n=1 Tax=Exiguobacterium antarcticum TaxID=132920 RepID=A0ABT6R1K4_9BACL|nr:hypothetical protein [Exiguobacterium antarcticum]MDI3234149.1 hypothetical protein [Exiguobacterium antarcticum]